MILSSRLTHSFTFRRDDTTRRDGALRLHGTMRASELSGKLRNEVRRSPRPAARFAELVRLSSGLLRMLESDPTLRITLNPFRAWLHDADTDRPLGTPPGADVVLFVVGEEVRTYAATMPERNLLHQLAEIGPTTLDAWLAHDAAFGHVGATRSELVELVRTATAAGLTAVS